jgi:Raf kinase inhibitor-like YbhB/YbcL family protein
MTRPRSRFAVRLAAATSPAAAGCAMPAFAGGLVAMDRPETAAHGVLNVTSAGFAPNGALPAKYAHGGDRSPPLQWSQANGARSYVVMVEDPDAPAASPYVHWLAWNIPGSVSALPEGVPSGPRVAKPVPMQQGRNGADATGYSGPNPPPGAPHHYHFEVFALDTALQAPPPGSDRDALLAAMPGHVIAKGDLVATYQQ